MRKDLKITTPRNRYRLVVGELIPSIESRFEYPLAVSAFFCVIQGLTLSPRRACIYAAIELRVDRGVRIFMLKDALTADACCQRRSVN